MSRRLWRWLTAEVPTPRIYFYMLVILLVILLVNTIFPPR